jgi:hypothetical protein
LRGQVLEQAGPALEKITRGMTILDGGDTKEAVGNLTNAAELAGRENVHHLTDPIAKQVAQGGMEERGSLLGRHDHRSEQEFADGVRDVMSETGNDLFARSLSNQLAANGDMGFAHAIATGGDVPGKNLAENINDFVGDAVDNVTGAAGAVTDFVGDLANAAGDFTRNKIAEAAGVDHRVEELNSEGDTFTMGLGGEVGAVGVQVGAAAEMQVERTDDGYTVTVSGEASAGIFAALGTNDAGGRAEANLTGRVSVEATFQTQEEAIEAAKTIAGIGIGTAIGGPVGAAVTAGTAGEEIRNFTDNISKTTFELELSGSARAGLNASLGLSDESGFGGTAGITASTSVALEVVPGQDPTLVLNNELSGDASLNLGLNDVGLPDGRRLSLANASAEGSVSLETRVPLGGTSLSEAMQDPVGAVRALGQNAIDNSTTTLTANVDVSGDIGFGVTGSGESGRSNSNASLAGGGLNAQISAEIPTRDIGGALNAALNGDLRGALNQVSENAEIEMEVNAVATDEFNIDESINAGIFRIGVEAKYESRDETSLFEFQGSADELSVEATDFFSNINPLS